MPWTLRLFPRVGVFPAQPEEIAAHLVEETRTGLSGSGFKTGIIKVSTGGRALSTVDERNLRVRAQGNRLDDHQPTVGLGRRTIETTKQTMDHA